MQHTRWITAGLLLAFATPAWAQPTPPAAPTPQPPAPPAAPAPQRDDQVRAEIAPDASDDPDRDDELLSQEELDAALIAAAGEVIEMSDSAPVEQAPPGVAELDTEEILTVPGARGDAIEAVRNLPGVASVSGYGGAGNLVVRGSSPEDTLYLVDGVEIPLMSHFGDLATVLPSAMIESIEFSPGGFGVEHGRATGGVVEIHTRPADLERVSGSAEVSFIHAAGFLQGPLWKQQNLSFSVGVRRSFVDALLPALMPDSDTFAFTTAPNYIDAQARVDWRPSYAHELSLQWLESSDRLDLVDEVGDPRDRTLAGRFESQDRFRRVIGRWRYRGDGVESLLIGAYGDSLERRNLNDEQFYHIAPTLASLREELSWRPHQRVTGRAGGEAQLVGGQIAARLPLPVSEGMPGNSNFTRDPSVDIAQPIEDDRYAAWAAVDVEPLTGLLITPGVRADHFRHLDATIVSPRLAASYRVAPALSVRAAVGEYSQPLRYAEAVPDHLDPERARHYVAGGEVTLPRGVSVAATGFYTDFYDLVTRDPDQMVEDPLDSYTNSGTGRAYGGELMLRARGERFFGWLAYTLSRSTRVDATGQDERLFDWDQTHNLVAVASWELGAWRLGGKFRLASGTPDTPVMGAVYLADVDTYEPIWGQTNSERLAISHQLDVRVDRTWRFDSWQLSAFLDIANVYANAPVLGYAYSFDYAEREEVTGLPFLPSFGIKGAF
ncbi:MAG: TonB-dependent receptor [Haliangiales bacterium]